MIKITDYIMLQSQSTELNKSSINNKIGFTHKLQQISKLLLKFVATNQSLYI